MEVEEFRRLVRKHASIIVRSRNGNEYLVNEDQLPYIKNTDVVCGDAINPHRRAKTNYRWFRLKNVTFVRSA